MLMHRISIYIYIYIYFSRLLGNIFCSRVKIHDKIYYVTQLKLLRMIYSDRNEII